MYSKHIFTKILEKLIGVLSTYFSEEFSLLYTSIVDDKVSFLEDSVYLEDSAYWGKKENIKKNKDVIPLFENGIEKTGFKNCHNCFVSLRSQRSFVFQKKSVCILCCHCANLYGVSFMGEDISIGRFMRTENTRHKILSKLE